MNNKVVASIVFCSLACCTLPALGGDDEAKAKLFPYIDSELLRRPAPVPESENALGTLQKLQILLRALGEAEFDALLDEVEEEAEKLDRASPLGQRVDRFLGEHQDVFAMLEGAVERGHVRFSDLGQSIDLALWRLTYLVRLESERMAEENSFGQAADLLNRLYRLGSMLCRSGMPIAYVRGLRMQDEAADAMIEMAAHEAIPNTVLQSLIDGLDRDPPSHEQLAEQLCAVFDGMVLESLKDLPENDNLSLAIDAVLSRPRAKGRLPAAINAQLDRRRQAVVSLLAGHPAAFNRAKTVRLASDLYVEAVHNAARPWNRQTRFIGPRIRKYVAAWPEAISLHPMDQLSVVLGNKQENVPEEVMNRASLQLAGVRNPLGKHIVAVYDPYESFEVHFRARANLEAAKARLAIRLYELRNGSLPLSFTSLRDAGILASAPRDPFGTELHYAPQKAIVWSVGPDGNDDGGRPEERHEESFFDFLRKARPAGAADSPLPPQTPKDRGGDLVWPVIGSSKPGE